MKIQYDFRENDNHPSIIEALKDGGKNTVESKPLLCGDYFCYPVLIEAKVTIADFIGSIQDGRLFQQAQDLLYNQKQDSNLKPYILIVGNIEDIFKPKNSINPLAAISAWASIASMGIPIMFLGNEWFFVKGMLKLFEKHTDSKNRTYIPVRKSSTNQDNVITMYMSIEGIGEVTAKRLALKFPIPQKLFNATIDELTEIEGIGKSTATKMLTFFNGNYIIQKNKVKNNKSNSLFDF